MSIKSCNTSIIYNFNNIEEYNKYLERKNSYNLNNFRSLTSNNTIVLANSILVYLEELKIIVCTKCKIIITPNIKAISRYFRVSLYLILIFNF